MKRNKIFQALLMTGVLLLTGCGEQTQNSSQGSEVQTVKPTAIVITSEGNVTKLEAGKTLQLKVSVTPEAADASVTWTSSHTDIATVSETGLVTGVKEGQVIIKATSKLDENVYKEFLLQIEKEKEPDPKSITVTLAGGATKVEVGKTLQATATVSPDKASQEVIWKSSDVEVATVSQTGLIKGLKAGKTTISATSKKIDTVIGSIEVNVEQGEVENTVDWATQAFASHDDYMSLAKDKAVKVKGTVTFKSPESVNKSGETTVSYFVQNGKEGFYIQYQPVALGSVEVGKSYEIGGFKQWKSGCNSIQKVEYLKPLEEVLPVETVDVTNDESLVYDNQKVNMGAKTKITGATVTSLPNFPLSSKGYNLKVKANKDEISIRVNPSDLTPEENTKVNEIVTKLLPGQAVDIEGIMNSFGYGKPASQILVTSSNSIKAKELDDQSKADLAVASASVPHTLSTEETITLPKTIESIPGVTLSWESNNEAINAETGAVTHGERDVDVTLTAKATAGEKTATKTYLVTVLSATDTYYTEVAKLDFEDASKTQKYGCSETKSGYAKGNVTLGGHEWEMDNCLIAGAEDDRREGTYAARFQTSQENGLTLVNGLNFDTVEFLLANYGKNPLGTEVQISYAIGESATFTTLERKYVITDYQLTKVRTKLPVQADDIVRVKISAVAKTGQRFNVDNVRLLKTNA